MSIKSIRTGWTGISALAGNPVMGDFESISSTTVSSGGAANIEFTSIPSTYQHLQIRLLAKMSGTASEYNQGSIQLNGDTASNYSWHRLGGTGAATFTSAGTSASDMQLPHFPDSNRSANFFGGYVIDILDYTNTNKYKTIRTIGGADQNGVGTVGLYSGSWRNTNAVTSIKILPTSTLNFVQYTTAALYGIKG